MLLIICLVMHILLVTSLHVAPYSGIFRFYNLLHLKNKYSGDPKSAIFAVPDITKSIYTKHAAAESNLSDIDWSRSFENDTTAMIMYIRNNHATMPRNQIMYALKKLSSRQAYKSSQQILSFVSLKDIMIWMKSNKDYVDQKFGQRDICTLMYLLYCSYPDSPYLNDYLQYLTHEIKQSKCKLSSKVIGGSLYGLKNHVYSVELGGLLDAIAEKIESGGNKMSISGPDASSALFGLRRLSSEHKEVRRLVNSINKRITSVEGDWEPWAISNALYGLQSMDLKTPEVQALLQSINLKAESTSQLFESVGIGNALFGLRSMKYESESSSNSSAVRANNILKNTVVILSEKLKTCYDDFSLDSLSRAVSGLQGFSDDMPEVRSILFCLAEKLLSNKEARHINAALSYSTLINGLQRMQGVSKELRVLLKVISMKLSQLEAQNLNNNNNNSNNKNKKKAIFTPREITSAIFGLQSISIKASPEVKDILYFFSEQVRLSESKFTVRNVATAMLSLRKHSSVDSFEVNTLISQLAIQLRTTLRFEKCWKDPQSFGMVMLGLEGASDERECVREMIASVVSVPLTQLDTQAYSNTFYAMNEMTAKFVETKTLLEMLIQSLSSAQEGSALCSPIEISSAIYGLKSMDSRIPIVRLALKQLSLELKKSMIKLEGFSFSSQSIGNALSGLQTMSDRDGEEIAEVLGLLADVADKSDVVMSPLDISNALFGLQGMTTECEETRAVIVAILNKMKKLELVSGGTALYSIRDIGYCLTGLHGMQRFLYPEVDEILKEIQLQVSKTDLGGQDQLTFLQFGKGIRIRSTKNAN